MFVLCVLGVCVRFALQHLNLLIPRNIWHDRTDAWTLTKYSKTSLDLLAKTPMWDGSNHNVARTKWIYNL